MPEANVRRRDTGGLEAATGDCTRQRSRRGWRRLNGSVLSGIGWCAYLGEGKAFADAVEVFSVAESHCVASDHKRLTEAIAAGDLPAADIEDARGLHR